MIRKREAYEPARRSIGSIPGLQECVRNALHVRRARLHAAVATAAIAVVPPLASGAAFPPVFPLADLYPGQGGNGTQGFVLNGTYVHEYSGVSVSSAGDVNGDGFDDVIVGGPGPRGLRRGAGRAYVVFGSAQGFPPVMPLESLLPDGGGDGSRGFVLKGIDEEDYAGGSVSGAGDINGDGIDDLIIGAHGGDPNEEMNAGEGCVVFGSAQGFPAIFPLASLYPGGGGDGSRGFVLAGRRIGNFAGWAVSGAGDVNGDGVDDLVIGAPGASPAGEGTAGESYVVFGSTQAFPAVFPLASLYPAGGGDGTKGFVIAGHFGGSDGGERSGSAVSGAGDINGDGVDDVVIGAYLSEEEYDGRAYVVFGSNEEFPAIFPLAALYPNAPGGDGSRGFVISGIDRLDETGASVSTGGDVNGDGIDDLIIGTRTAVSYVLLGTTQGFPAVFSPAQLYPGAGGDGSRGFVIHGAGSAVSDAGDVNDDGIADLIVGSPGTPVHGVEGAGVSCVVYGSTEGFPPIFPIATLFPDNGGDGSRGVVLAGTGGQSGKAVSDAGDVNDDVIVGAWLAEPGGQEFAGASYVVFGRSDAP